MDFTTQWNEICDDTSILLEDVASSGMTQTNSNNIHQTEEEILQLLSLIPSIFADLQRRTDVSREESDKQIEKINFFQKQAEIALTILDELKTETSAVKMRNIVYTWGMRDEII